MAGAVKVVIRKKAMQALAESTQMGRLIVDNANTVRAKGQQNAPVSRSGSHGRRAGYLRARIQVKYARDAVGVYADVVTGARTPKGFPYGRLQEQRLGYLKHAIE